MTSTHPKAPPSPLQAICQLCGSAHHREVYAREVETASDAGRFELRLALCLDCGLLFQSRRVQPEILDAYYANSACASGSVWHEVSAGTFRGGLIEDRVAFVQGLATAFPAPGFLLDVGCGRGDFLRALNLPGWTRFGLEPSAPAAARARELGLNVIETTLESSHRAGKEFDLVTCISCLEHVDDIRVAMQALRDLVKAGGLLILEVPDSCRPIAQVAEFFSFEHLTHFSPGTLRRLLAQFGFELIRFDRRAPSALRIGARRVERVLPIPADSDDQVELLDAIQTYAAGRLSVEEEIRGRVEELIRSARRIAIFGAGDHTRFLLDLLDLADHVVTIIDSDPSKIGTRFLRWHVHAPEELGNLGVDAVVISSKPFQEDMVARIAPIAAAADIEVVRCYPSPETEL